MYNTIILMLLMIGLNVLIVYLYEDNALFPILFMIFEIIFGLSIVAENEIYVIFMIAFSVFYNVLTSIEINRRN